MLYATVVLELPLSKMAQDAIANAKNVHDEAQKMHPNPEDRKPFAINNMYELTAVQHELERKKGEALDKLRQEMTGWTLRADETYLFLDANTIQVKQQFFK